MSSLINFRNLSSIELFLLLLAGGLAFAGQQFSIPFLTNLALHCLGLMMVLVGGEFLVTKRAEFAIGGWVYIQARETFKGLAAQLWGVLFLGLGLLVILVTLAKWLVPAAAGSFWSRLQGTPTGAGLALAGLGLAACLYGLIRLLAGSAGVDLGRLTSLSNLLDRLAGGVVFLLGLGLIFLGVSLVIAPGVLSAIITRLAAWLLH
jgi:hypothetical protein